VSRFLADESCDFAVVRALRAEGHDVVAVAEYTARSVDSELIEQAHSDRRILLTEDNDFGWLVFVSQSEMAGVVLIRFPGNARRTLAETVTKLVQEHGDELADAFVVVQPGYIRLHRRSDPRPE
jgi:predicted nuclease of predicted toxin-antitoxin system